jgi:alkanesulfonate monooxygenase SsuD/methylene tetrahydromethanopterin reductase-like flavin-dependent oxidoreductase (luciferase family)
MKFGVHLPTVRLNDPDPLAMLTEFVSESDAMGYEYLAVNDHFFNVLDPVTSLAAVAGATKHMRFIPAGLLPIHRGLVPTAKMFVTLDLFTGGRMIAGLAAGSSNVEYTINNLDPTERWQRFDEIAVALRSLL